jgi:hypothetical protein
MTDMKKYISIIFMAALVSVGFVACDVETDEDAGGTNVQDMAGFWEVKVDGVKSDGSFVSDPYSIGTISMETYNTASNAADSMWVNDGGAFWGIKFKVPVNYAAKTFSCESKCYDPSNAKAGNAVITDGKILIGKGHNLHGMATDSIFFKVKFDDDDTGMTYQIAGIKHSGFSE